MKTNKLGEFHPRKVLYVLLEVTYLTVFFAIPLAMAWFLPTDNVFELNKIVLFRSLVYVFFVLTLAKALFFPSKQKFSGRYLIPVLVLLVFGAVSLFFSVDPANSYFGLSDRQQGYRSLLFYAWWFFLLFYNLATAVDIEKKINRIFWVIMGSSFLVCLYGILQILGIDFIAWTEPPFITHRVTSTLGQPNYLGSYLLLLIPLTIYGWVKHRNFYWRFALAILLLMQLITLVITSSRSAWLGLLGALALLVFWNLTRFWPKLSAPRKRGLVLISLLSVLLLGLLLLQNNYIGSRLRGMTDFKGGSVSARFNFWSGAWGSFLQKPLMGYGLENQGREFIKYYQVDWAQTGFVNASTNRAHNIILDILLTGGLVGLLVYTWLYSSFFRWASQARTDSKYRFWLEVLMAAVLAYLISLFFGFAVVVTEIYFFSYLAIVAALRAKLENGGESNFIIRLRGWIKVAIIVLAVVFSLRQISLEFRSIVVDNYFLEMRQVLADNDYAKALLYYQKIKGQSAFDFSYGYYLVDALPYNLEALGNPLITNLFQRELKNILPTLNQNSHDSYYLQAKIYTLLKDDVRAEESYNQAIALSPQLPKDYFARAKFYIVFQKDDLALADLKKVLELLPAPKNYLEALSSAEKSVAAYRGLVLKEIGDLYFRQEKYALAGEVYRSSYLLNLGDLVVYKKIADTYFMRGDLLTAIWYNLRAFERHPDDYVWPFSLAVLYQEQGDHVSAVKYLDLAIGLDAQKKIPAEIIKNIKSSVK